jgi:hypothetical protein
MQGLEKRFKQGEEDMIVLINQAAGWRKKCKEAEAARFYLAEQIKKMEETSIAERVEHSIKLQALKDDLAQSDVLMVKLKQSYSDLVAENSVLRGQLEDLIKLLDAFVVANFVNFMEVQFFRKGIWVDDEDNTNKSSKVEKVRLKIKFLVPSNSTYYNCNRTVEVVLNNESEKIDSKPKKEILDVKSSKTVDFYLFMEEIEFTKSTEKAAEGLQGVNYLTVTALGGKVHERIKFKLE